MMMAGLALSFPVLAEAARAADPDAAKLYGTDPGLAPARACFAHNFDPAWLAGHKDQNVSQILVQATRRVDEGTAWDLAAVQLRFRDSHGLFEISADCSLSDGAIHCGVDCDGGGFSMKMLSASALGVSFDGYVRFSDTTQPVDPEATVDPPLSTAGFGQGDKTLVLERVDPKNCSTLADDSDAATSDPATPSQ
jgi:hypothetical protein